MLKLNQNNKQYPPQLLRLNDPPKTIYVNSNNWDDLTKQPMLAIVGTRRPTPYGKAVCQQLSRELASRGVVIVSGLALGIDSIAHEAALKANGKTIAVLPSGFNNIYPASHRNLALQIVENGGALISEYTPEEKVAFKSNFIARNRIIAGLCSAILVPEAAEGSGSLHTAQFGLEIGVDVLAVPGQITNPLSRGTNNLIKTGALLVNNVSDILNVLKIPALPHAKTITASNENEDKILKSIANGVNDADIIVQQTGIDINTFNQTLTMLEINGQIRPGGNNTWYLN